MHTGLLDVNFNEECFEWCLSYNVQWNTKSLLAHIWDASKPIDAVFGTQ